MSSAQAAAAAASRPAGGADPDAGEAGADPVPEHAPRADGDEGVGGRRVGHAPSMAGRPAGACAPVAAHQ